MNRRINRNKNQTVSDARLSVYLDEQVARFNQPNFIQDDPISIPHRFTRLQDIEIMALWTAVLAWGQRVTIIKSAEKLITLMDGAPYDFVTGHQDQDLKRFLSFRHRTFNDIDTLYFLHFFKQWYQHHNSLEEAFLCAGYEQEIHVEKLLIHFHNTFFNDPVAPHRTRKHIATPQSKSSCKRINMFLRWMVRKDRSGVDFGLWNHIRPNQLICPLDVHVDRVARKLGLIERKQTDWRTAVALTERLRMFDPDDPVKYDFALFGIGVDEKKSIRF